MPMQSCPPEVLEQIFSLACCDGGWAGCALSAVSRYIRDTSAAHRYYSVTLRGHRQIDAFCSLFANDLTFRIHHLFLCLQENEAQSTFRAVTGVSSTSDDQVETITRMLLLLRRTSPTLETLCLVLSQADHHGDVLPELQLPALRDFTLVIPKGYPHESWPSVLRQSRNGGVRGQQSIRRVHLVTPGRLTLNTSHYAAFAPNLTHLRVSCTAGDWDYGDMRETIENETQKVAGFVWSLLDDLPSTIQRMLLQILLSSESEDSNLSAVRPLVPTLQGLADIEGGKRQLTLLENAHFPTPYDEDDAYVDWLDVVSGGEGCWGAKVLGT